MTEPRRQAVETALGRITCIDSGPSDGPALLLLHGLGGNARTWQRQLARFAASRRVIAWDAPGYGGSDVVDGTVDAYAAAALALLDGLGIERADVVGHSMGGVVATGLVAAAPARVGRLVLSCSFTGGATPEGGALAAGLAARLDDLRRLPAAEFGMARAIGMTAPGVARDILAEVAAIAAEIRVDGFVAACRMLSEADTRPLFAGIACPVLFLSAEHDRVIAREVVDAMARLLPRAGRVHLGGVGHAPYIEDPEAYNGVLSDFLGPPL